MRNSALGPIWSVWSYLSPIAFKRQIDSCSCQSWSHGNKIMTHDLDHISFDITKSRTHRHDSCLTIKMVQHHDFTFLTFFFRYFHRWDLKKTNMNWKCHSDLDLLPIFVKVIMKKPRGIKSNWFVKSLHLHLFWKSFEYSLVRRN